MSRIVSGLAIASLLTAACGPSWPSRATTVSDPRVAPASYAKIDVLPVDLQLWADDDMPFDPEEIRTEAETVLLQSAVDRIRSNHEVANHLDWGGTAFTAEGPIPAMDPKALDATVGSLSGYGSIAGDTPHKLPVPYLPARLGEQTGADATLYIGGWSYVAKQRAGTGTKIAEGVLIAVAVVAVVGIVLAVASSSKGSSHSGGGHGGGGHGGGSGLAKASSHVAGLAARDALRAGNVALEVGRATARVAGDVIVESLDAIPPDAWGRHIEVPDRPDWAAGADRDGHSRMYLEMTLVDNRTGLAIWHAQQTFPAGADRGEQVQRAARVMLASMPR